jgi:rubrerythrin
MMIFDVAEVIDMGIEKEKKRRDFYKLVADRFERKEIKDLFERLRDWEETHIKKFSEVRESVREPATAESYPGELEAYMSALVDDKLYDEVSPDQFSGNVKDARDAIRYAIGFEKDAILFFNELLRYMKSPEREPVEKLISEEKQHIVYLSELRREVK